MLLALGAVSLLWGSSRVSLRRKMVIKSMSGRSASSSDATVGIQLGWKDFSLVGASTDFVAAL